MATDMSIKFEDPDFPERGTIDVLGFQVSYSDRGSRDTPQDLTFTKYMDEHTPALLRFTTSGKRFRKATLRFNRVDFAIVMERVSCANFSVSGGAGDLPVESVTLDFGTIQYDYLSSAKRNDDGPMPKAVASFRATNAKPASTKKPAKKK